MSKQSEAKKQQGYVNKAIPRTCCNCVYFRMEVEDTQTAWGAAYQKEKNLHCFVGGFAVKKMATCNAFKLLRA